MQVGIDSFAAAFDDNSLAVSPQDRLRHLVEQIEHADQVGLDVFGVGEHHRREFLDSAPAVILGAAAARTHRIRLTSAVTVLSAADPVRVFWARQDEFPLQLWLRGSTLAAPATPSFAVQRGVLAPVGARCAKGSHTWHPVIVSAESAEAIRRRLNPLSLAFGVNTSRCRGCE